MWDSSFVTKSSFWDLSRSKGEEVDQEEKKTKEEEDLEQRLEEDLKNAGTIATWVLETRVPH